MAEDLLRVSDDRHVAGQLLGDLQTEENPEAPPVTRVHYQLPEGVATRLLALDHRVAHRLQVLPHALRPLQPPQPQQTPRRLVLTVLYEIEIRRLGHEDERGDED